VAPVLCTMLVGYGLIPKEVAAQLPEQLVTLTLAIGGVVTAGMTLWSIWSNRAPAIAKQTASVPGVVVGVNPVTASEPMKELARDPSIADVKWSA
jgi:hypothetical protein